MYSRTEGQVEILAGCALLATEEQNEQKKRLIPIAIWLTASSLRPSESCQIRVRLETGQSGLMVPVAVPRWVGGVTGPT